MKIGSFPLGGISANPFWRKIYEKRRKEGEAKRKENVKGKGKKKRSEKIECKQLKHA